MRTIQKNNYKNLFNEGGEGYNPYEEEENFQVTYWSKEETIVKKEKWNKYITTFKNNDQKVTQNDIAKFEKENGYSMNELKENLKYHDLLKKN